MSIYNIFDIDSTEGLEKLLDFCIPLTENDEIINKEKKKERNYQFDIFDTELIATVVNYYINGASILEISHITKLSNDMVDEILDRVIPYLD